MEITQGYISFKQELDSAMHQAAESFVKIGYLLRRAKDTSVLFESPYDNVNDFAKAEYGITPDQVSRYIRINERFSVNGYGQQLRDDMQGYGIGKLQIMLTMSDEVVEVIPPEISKAEVQAVQREIKEEAKKTDIEVALETQNPITGTMLEKFVKQYFHDNTEQYEKVYEGTRTLDAMIDVIAPSGVALLRTRIKGEGVLMLSIKGLDQQIDVVNVRSNEKESFKPEELIQCFIDIFVDITMKARDMWREIFMEEWPEQVEEPVIEKKEEIAPVQQVIPETKKPNEETKEEENVRDIESVEKKVTESVNEEHVHIVDSEEENIIQVEENIEPKNNLKESTLKEMKHCARKSLANAKVSMDAGGWKAALEDAKNLVHYLSVIVGEGEVNE